jgi:hypothetical protein
LGAADGYLKAVVLNQTLGSDANNTDSLTQEDRTFYLQKADALYAAVVADDDSNATNTLFAVGGLSGRAAVAEANGDIDSARKYYESIITRAGAQYPALAAQAQSRIDSLESLSASIELPSEAEIAARTNQVLKRDPKSIDSDIDSLIAPR